MSCQILVILLIALVCLNVNAFVPAKPRPIRAESKTLLMGNNAKFGIFSPVVVVAKLALGEAKLNKVLNFILSTNILSHSFRLTIPPPPQNFFQKNVAPRKGHFTAQSSYYRMVPYIRCILPTFKIN